MKGNLFLLLGYISLLLSSIYAFTDLFISGAYLGIMTISMLRCIFLNLEK